MEQLLKLALNGTVPFTGVPVCSTVKQAWQLAVFATQLQAELHVPWEPNAVVHTVPGSAEPFSTPRQSTVDPPQFRSITTIIVSNTYFEPTQRRVHVVHFEVVTIRIKLHGHSDRRLCVLNGGNSHYAVRW